MPPSLAELEQQRSRLAAQLSQLGDLRPGSVTGIVRRCGKPTCQCAQPDDPGHGPTLRLTYKAQGQDHQRSFTVTSFGAQGGKGDRRVSEVPGTEPLVPGGE